jgi:hypothetical protein
VDINDIKQQAAETIYLVPDSSEGRLGYVWCDDPAPGEGLDPSEAVEYVRKDVHEARIAELEQAVALHEAAENMQIALREKAEEREEARTNERDTAAMRLANTRGRLDGALAHIDRIIAARNSRRGDTLANICAVIDESTYQTSLARRDLIKQAEAFANAATICQKVKDGQDSLAWMHREVSPDGEEYIGDLGIPYSNKAFGAQYCVDDLKREAQRLLRQAEEAGQ